MTKNVHVFPSLFIVILGLSLPLYPPITSSLPFSFIYVPTVYLSICLSPFEVASGTRHQIASVCWVIKLWFSQ